MSQFGQGKKSANVNKIKMSLYILKILKSIYSRYL